MIREREQNEFPMPFHMDRVVEGWDTGIDLICRNAPHVIVTHAPKNDLAAPAACVIALLSCLDLAASSFGPGACRAGYFNTAATMWPPMQEALGFPGGVGMATEN